MPPPRSIRPRVRLVVPDAARALDVRAVGAAVEGAVRLDPVADDLAAAVRADGSELVNGALEAVERVCRAGRDYLKGEVVLVAADFALGHRSLRDRVGGSRMHEAGHRGGALAEERA